MELINKDLVLKEIPLFAGLSLAERSIIEQRCDIVEYKKDQAVYHEGAPADAFYCVISGRVVIYTRDRYGQDTILEYLHRGKYFGIISLLTGGPHSVSAHAINDSFLLVIKKNDFDSILKKIPQLAIDLSQTLSRRLKNKDIHQKTIFESTVASVFSSHSQAGKTVYALNLAISLHKETHKSVIILDIALYDKIHSLPARLGMAGNYGAIDLCGSLDNAERITKDFLIKNNLGIDLLCLWYSQENESCIGRLVAILSLLLNDYHYIILDLPSAMDKFVFSILNQSEAIHILTGPDPVNLKRSHNLIARLKANFYFPESKIKVLVNEYKLSNLTYGQQLGILNHPIFATLPRIEFKVSDKLVLEKPDSEYAKAIRRIARQVGDCLVGLALGVGVAYGFCHIGVLKVIEEEMIPIDVISGSSIGAFIASLWATGRSSQEILEITREFKEPKHIWGFVDLTFPRLGFIKGKKLYRFIRKYLGNKTFHDVRLPLKIIASDVRRKVPKVLEHGLLADAIMTSCSMPGVFIPFRSKEDILLDGGVINPLPTEVLFKMGIKKIIAVSVTPTKEDILCQYQKIKEQIISTRESTRKKRWFDLGQYLRGKFKTNILDIIFSSIEVMQSELVQKEAQLADIILHPDTQGLYWLELHRAEEFAQRGEEEARRNLERIRQIINE